MNNEFSYQDANGEKQTISIPPSLLISAMGQIDDVSKAITMDAKEPGNVVYLVGETKHELGGSHLSLVKQLSGGQVPTVDAECARTTFAKVHEAIQARWIRSCHDLSEGGLAVAAAEMAMAGGLGMVIEIVDVCADGLNPTEALFSESNSRFLVEVAEEHAEEFEGLFFERDPHLHRLGTIDNGGELLVTCGGELALQVAIADVKEAWQQPLDWS